MSENKSRKAFMKIKKKGFVIVCKDLVNKFLSKIDYLSSTLTGNKRLLYVSEHNIEEPVLPHGLKVLCYHNINSIPNNVIVRMTEDSGGSVEDTINWLTDEFSKNGILWLGFIHDVNVVRQWIRHGKYFDRWFIELRDNDYVFFATSTFKEWRGKGLSPALQRHIIFHEQKAGGKAYGDIVPSNKASIRTFEKAGFKYFATMKHYDR